VCGILVVISRLNDRIDVAEAQVMLDTLKHRGPDDSRVLTESQESVFLGFNRLSIIDTSDQAMQPMTDNSKRFTLVFNGEIYNYLELRTELIGLGYRFNSNGDGEVIVNAFHAWGEECFPKFNGMWAIAIYDSLKKQLIVCRDRFGVKPMYYSQIKNRIYFASELKAFSKIQGVSFEIDPLEINFGHLFPSALPNTILAGVNKILPGQLLRISQESLKTVFKRWWSTPDEVINSLTNSHEIHDSLDEILDSSIRLRMRSDVPVAFSLSSGVDSTLIISRAVEMGFHSVTAFSQGTSDIEDESILAAKTARALGIDFRVSNLEDNFSIELLLQSIYALEGSQSLGIGVLAHYKDIADAGFKVVIEGHAGDELFGGYESQYRRIALQNLIRLSPNSWLKARRISLSLDGHSSQGTLSLLHSHFLTDLIESMRAEANKLRRHKSWKREIDLRLKSFGLDCTYNPFLFEKQKKSMGAGNYMLLQDFSFVTLPKILENFDKLSMSKSLEVRSPFLDWRFVLASFSISDDDKFLIDRSKQKLRDLMPAVVPESVRNKQRKLGFTGHPSWLLIKSVQDLILDISNSQAFLQSPHWNGHEIASDIELSLRQRASAGVMKHWGKIQLAIFMEAFSKSKI